jgi:predicted metal-binding protein
MVNDMDISNLVTIQHCTIDSNSVLWTLTLFERDKKNYHRAEKGISPIPDYRLLWCQRKYPRHSKGCPNYNKSDNCPPNVPHGKDQALQYGRYTLIWAHFDLHQFKEIRRTEHPDWSERQLGNSRHWQNQLKRMMRDYIREQFNFEPDSESTDVILFGAGSGFWNRPSMEAVGINVLSTLKKNKIKYLIKPDQPKKGQTSFVTMVALLLSSPIGTEEEIPSVQEESPIQDDNGAYNITF